MSSGHTLSSVRNAARLLKEFSSSQPDFGVSELARRLDLGKSTVHRLLSTLAAENLLTQDPDTGRYRLGLAMYDLGNTAVNTLDLHEALAPPMTHLRNLTGETVQAAVLDHREVIYIERLDSPNTLKLFLEVGKRNSAYDTSTGKCLLAHLDEAALARTLDGWKLAKKTEFTVTTHRALRQQLAEIRSQGYAINDGESELGVLSVAAPVRDRSRAVVAAISVAGPDSRLKPALLKLTQAVMETAATASNHLGYRR